MTAVCIGFIAPRDWQIRGSLLLLKSCWLFAIESIALA